MLLSVTHDTHYRYLPAVEMAQHVACMRPRPHAMQAVLDHSLQINPQAAHRREVQDVFGNVRCFFALQTPHEVLQLIAHSLVRTQAPPAAHSAMPWERVREHLAYEATAPFDAASEFVFASPYAPLHPQFADYARACFGPGTTLLEGCVALMERIHQEFTYASQSTQVNTPALQAFEQRKGVCQDFAHIMVACLRALGLSARYVSGYLLTQPPAGQTKLVGSDASHAWVSVYVPDLPQGARWCDFDPTNNRWGWHTPGEDYVSVAWGRDFGDVSPLRGVIHGGANHVLSVGVTVQAVGENTLLAGSGSQTQTQTQTQSPSQGPTQTQSQSQNFF